MGDSSAFIHNDFDAREELIFRAALSEFCKKGYDDASIASITASLGISEALIYKHVEGKMELLYRALAVGYEDEVALLLADIGDNITSAQHGIRQLVRAQVRGWKRNPRYHLLYFHESRKPMSKYSHILVEKGRRYFSAIQNILQQGLDRGELHPGIDLAITRDMIVGGIDQAVWWRAERGLPIPVEKLSEKISLILLRGLLK